MIENLKKCSWLLVGLCLVMFLFGCDSSGGSDDSDDLTTDPYPSISVEPYLPTSEFTAPIAAQYKTTVDLEKETISGTKYVTKDIETIYLFDDNTWVKTETKVYVNTSTGTVTRTDKKPEEKGAYVFNSGDVTNGSITLTVSHDWDDDTSSWEADTGTVTITPSSGKFKIGTDSYSSF